MILCYSLAPLVALNILCLQICEAYNANRYPFPEDPARQRQMNAEVTARLRELHTTIEAGEACAQGHLPVAISHSLCTVKRCLHRRKIDVLLSGRDFAAALRIAGEELYCLHLYDYFALVKHVDPPAACSTVLKLV